MKTIITILLLAAVTACDKDTIEAQVDASYISPDVYEGSTNALRHLPNGNETLQTDFILGEPLAVSNAITKGLPDGWDIVCDGKGHYAARSDHSFVIDFQKEGWSADVRTNYFQATVVAWRTQGIWDAPIKIEPPQEQTNYQWDTCDK